MTASTVFALGLPSLAHADSIVFVKGGNVWIAKPDGTAQTQITRDGSAGRPYGSPTQADDGTIAASQATEIVRLRQDGTVLNRMDPPPLTDSAGSPVDGTPVDVAISPDGSRIAYTLVDAPCQVGSAGCDARPATAITPADRMAPTGGAHSFDSSWVTNSRLLTFAPYPGQVNTLDLGQERAFWFDDNELVAAGSGTDQSDGEVNPQGTYLATIRGAGPDRSVMWLKIRGDVRTGSRAAGTLLLPDVTQGCVTTSAVDLAGPTWSPNGMALAWHEGGAIHVWSDVARCAGASSRAVITGAGEPDWGPADAPVVPGDAVPGPPAGGGGTKPPADKTKEKGGTKKKDGSTPGTKTGLKLAKSVGLKPALKRGIRVRITGAKAGKATFTAKIGGKKVASGTATIAKTGKATATLRFTKAAKRTLAKRKRVVLKVSGAGTSGTVTLKR